MNKTVTCGSTKVDQGSDVDKLADTDAAVAAQAEHRNSDAGAPPWPPSTQRPVGFHENSWGTALVFRP